ncbi:solute carrier family 17 member 9-like [Thalassophryne amazonica]|uniref:solute carrier family 17 member 9-like n=1 Tax=Thalassophryne amazonica TaxID=390379 RepID=UPI00147240F1|nr:solute carrier family 17 member 9-like [Thalassophryne amazonica]
MAEQHKLENDSNSSDDFLLDLSIFTSQASVKEEVDQNLWARPLARKWTSMLFLGTCLLYCARMAMPICAVSMAAGFGWSKIDTGLVLGGFFWGYCGTQVLGGHASDRLGGERVLLLSTALWTLITAATPLLAKVSTHSLLLMTLARLLMGLVQGVYFPSLASLCSQRVVESERGFLMSSMYSGCYLGTVLAGGLGSLMLEGNGWESIFYCTGLMSGLWALVVWQCLMKGRALPTSVKSMNESHWNLARIQLWLSFLQRTPVWAMVCAHMCMTSTNYTLLVWLPTYFHESFPNATGWSYNIIPWLLAIPSALSGGCVSDFLISNGYGVSHVRKIMQFLAMGMSSMFLVLLSGVDSFPLAVAIISVALSFTTFSISGVCVNVQDLTPSCAGALFGFMNTIGAFMGLVLISLSGYLIEVTQSWSSVFSLIVLVNVTGLAIFLVFGDAHRVDLNHCNQTKNIR